MKKSVYVLVMISVLIWSLTACMGDTSSVQASGNVTADASQGMEEEIERKYPIIVDNYGREVIVNAKPKKVLTLGPNCTELFVALGLTDYIVGNSLKNHSRGPLPEYAKEFEKIPELNYGSATREAVISSGADFIYGLDWEFSGDALNIHELEDYGMTIYMNSATTMEAVYQEILNIGKIFEVEKEAKAFVEEQKKQISEVKEKVLGQQAPKVLIYDSGNNGVFTCSGINFESLLVEMAGGKNLFDDLNEKAWVTVSYEEVLAREPDVILIHDYDSPSVEEKIAEIKANDMLAQLDCVKNNRFVVIELESVLPGNRMAYTIQRLANGFFPELFKES